MKRFLTTCIAIIAVTAASAQAYRSGERLTIEVEYWAALWPNTTVGKVVCEAVEDGGNMRISATATLSGLFGWMYKLNDSYVSWVNPTTGLPVRSTSNLKEGSWIFASRYDFKHEKQGVSVTVASRRGDETEFTTRTIAAPENVMDGIALFYWLRSQDVGFLAKGESKILPVMLEDTVRHIKITFHGTERRKINRAMTNTLKYSCQAFKRGSQRELMGHPFYIWLSDDQNHLPLLLESPIRIGNIRATLISAENVN